MDLCIQVAELASVGQMESWELRGESGSNLGNLREVGKLDKMDFAVCSSYSS